MKKIVLGTTFTALVSIGGFYHQQSEPETDHVEVPYIKAVYSRPVTYDPAQMNDGASLIFSELVYEGLLRFTESYGVQAGIAKSWNTSKDGKTLTFILNENAKFHNGYKITALDVVASLSRMMDHFEVGAHGGVQLVDWDGNVLWEFIRCEIGKHSLHHDMEPLPNGNILVTSYEAFSADAVKAMGWDPTKTRTQINAGQGPNAPSPEVIWMEKILELKPNLDDGSTEIVWEWNSWDHVVQDVDPDKPNYGVIKDEPGKIDLNFRAMQARQLHFNSIDYDPETRQILLSSLMFGEVWVLDHSTTTAEAATDKGGKQGKGGDLIYRWGMPAAYDSGPESERQLVGQHDARWTRGLSGKGDITVHNNVAGVVDGVVGKTIFQVGSRFSSIVEIDIGMNEDGSYDKEAGKPFGGERTWTFTAEPKNSWYSPFMGGASRLPNGNTLIVNSHNKRLIEVTPEGERVLDYNFPGLGRMFRAYKLDPNHPGLAGRL